MSELILPSLEGMYTGRVYTLQLCHSTLKSATHRSAMERGSLDAWSSLVRTCPTGRPTDRPPIAPPLARHPATGVSCDWLTDHGAMPTHTRALHTHQLTCPWHKQCLCVLAGQWFQFAVAQL